MTELFRMTEINGKKKRGGVRKDMRIFFATNNSFKTVQRGIEFGKKKREYL